MLQLLFETHQGWSILRCFLYLVEKLLAVLRQQKQRKSLAKAPAASVQAKESRKVEDSTPKREPSISETPKKEPRPVKAESKPRSKDIDRSGVAERLKEIPTNKAKENSVVGLGPIPLPEKEVRPPLRSPHIAVTNGKVTIDYGSYPVQDTLAMMLPTTKDVPQREATPYIDLPNEGVSNYNNANMGYSFEMPETNDQEHSGLSYGKVFGMSAYDYAFDFVPPTYRRHRRHSDSDSESVRNFMSSNMPIHGILELEEKKPTPLQPMKWISKKTRKKSEDQRRKAFPVR